MPIWLRLTPEVQKKKAKQPVRPTHFVNPDLASPRVGTAGIPIAGTMTVSGGSKTKDIDWAERRQFSRGFGKGETNRVRTNRGHCSSRSFVLPYLFR